MCSLLTSTQAFATPDPEDSYYGCLEFSKIEFEDGSHINRYISENILEGLSFSKKTKALGKFLEDALIIQGYLNVNDALCGSIKAAIE